MKWALLTTILGYIILWQITHVGEFILPVALICIFTYVIFIFSKRIDALPSIKNKSFSLFVMLFFSIFILLGLQYLISSQRISIWWYPVIFGFFVLCRSFFKFVINLTVKEPKSFGVISITRKGETVRSKSEKMIADWFYANNFEYTYEKKIKLLNNQVMLSDFYLNDYDIYIEYWGLTNVENKVGENYRKRKTEKKSFYDLYNYKLIDIYPHHLYELDSYIPEQITRLTQTSPNFLLRLRYLFLGYPKQVTLTISSRNQSQTGSELFCTNCGNQVTRYGEFCVRCGILVESD